MMGLILRATGLLVTSSRNGNDTALIGNEFIIVLCRCFDFVLAFFVIMGWYGGIYHVVSCINVLYCVDCMQYLVLQRVKSLVRWQYCTKRYFTNHKICLYFTIRRADRKLKIRLECRYDILNLGFSTY